MSRTHSSSELCLAANLWSEVKVCSPAVRMWTSLCRTQDTYKLYFITVVQIISKYIWGLVKYFTLSAITTVLLVCIPFELVSDFSPHKLEKQFFPPQQKHFEEAHSQNVQIFSTNLCLPQNFEGHPDDCQNFLWLLKTKLQFTFNC